ncbi:DUF2283 domain-containing protein [Candidatus Woesearchaeota archaeon]|nr:DUF2283 domain-containing protein [Candidatus Woesearchaeota archaeon]
MKKQLNAKGKGVFDYDYKQDTLFFKIKDREYAKSIDFDEIVIDIDKEDYITGIQIFNASKIFKLDKKELRNIKYFEFDTRVEHNTISIRLLFNYIRRNKVHVERGQNLTFPAASPLTDSKTLCTVPA